MNVTNVIIALALTFLLGLVAAPWILPMLRRLKFSKSILEIGPSWHKKKQGTPTAGGIMFVLPILVVSCLLGAPYLFGGDWRLLITLVFVMLCAAIGFIDDYTKIKNKHNKGLSVLQKTILLMAVIALFIGVMYVLGYISDTIFIPFINTRLHLGYFYFIIMIPLCFFFVNSVNLTDGLDGLVSSVTLPYTISFIFISAWLNTQARPGEGIAVFAASVTGGLLMFLIYNFYPARVFMGDTGSLFLGGCVVALAMAFEMPYFLIMGGLVYLIEGLSVVLQVAFFKLTHGKRLFKMTPIHHHFELCGMKETSIVFMFTAVSALMCIIALGAIVYYKSFIIM